MNRFKHLYIYMLSSRVDYNSILTYLTSMINCNIERRGADALYKYNLHDAVKMYAKCKVNDVFREIAYSYAPINEYKDEDEDIEETGLFILVDGYLQSKPIVYDGFCLQSIYSSMIAEEESSLDYVHIIITDMLIATYSEEDMRYHLNTVVLGYPNIVSTTGIIEAPAKPKEFYTLYYYYLSQGITISMDELKSIFKDTILEHDDPRLTDIVKGYIMQAVFYSILKDAPFCNEKRCILYNAHWQDEVIEAHIRNGGLCQRHREVLDEFNRL
ncbi:MAG: DUF6775 family putative metallopeptidase [Candidatus Nitrosocaldus sp.]